MAQTFLVTNIQVGNFEDLANFITRISYDKTPFMSKAGRGKAKAIKHEWVTQALRAGATNERAEGYAPTFAAADQTPRVRRSNQVQFVANPFSVAGTQDSVDKSGLGQGSEYEEQKELQFKQLSLDMDFELLRSVAVTRDADAGTAGEMDGLLAWAPAGNTRNANNDVLRQETYNAVCQAMAEQGSDPDVVIAAGYQRRMISSWTQAFKSFELSGKTTLTDTVEIYKGDFGQQSVMYDKQMTPTDVVIFQSSYVKVAFLRPAFHTELGLDGDRRRGFVGSELTLEALNPNAIGRIQGLGVAV